MFRCAIQRRSILERSKIDRMRALIFKAVGEPLAVETIPDPEPLSGEVIVRVSRCGVCGTDLHATSGHGRTLLPDSQLGHEYGGEVVAIGKGVERFRIGDRLAAMAVVGCGHCDDCKTGIDALCSMRTSYTTGLAEYSRVSERGATKLPTTVSLADSALVEPLAVSARGVRLASPAPDSKVVIIGPGPIGLGVLFWLRQRRVENVVVLASSPRRRELAAKMGADSFAIESDSVADEIRFMLGGSPDIVFETAGVPGVFARAIELVRAQGLIIGLGYCTSPDPIVPATALFKDLTIRWSLIYTREDYADCVAALERHADLARAMVTETVGMHEAPAAFEIFREGMGGGGKLLIDPWG